MIDKMAPQPMESHNSPWTETFQLSVQSTASNEQMTNTEHGHRSQAHVEQQPTHDALADVYNRFDSENNHQ